MLVVFIVFLENAFDPLRMKVRLRTTVKGSPSFTTAKHVEPVKIKKYPRKVKKPCLAVPPPFITEAAPEL